MLWKFHLKYTGADKNALCLERETNNWSDIVLYYKLSFYSSEAERPDIESSIQQLQASHPKKHVLRTWDLSVFSFKCYCILLILLSKFIHVSEDKDLKVIQAII